MLLLVFLLTTVATAMAENPPAATSQEPANSTADPWSFTESCVPVSVTCNSPSGCILRDTDDISTAFCTGDFADTIFAGQTKLVEVVPTPDRLFHAFHLGAYRGIYPIAVPVTAKSCRLDISASDGRSSAVNLACDFVEAVPAPTYLVDYHGTREVIRKAGKGGEEQSKPDESQTDSATTASQGDQQQKAARSKEKHDGQEETTNSPNPAGQGGQQQKQGQ